MKRFALLTLAALLALPQLALAGDTGCFAQFRDCIFYGGDFDPNNPDADGLANETDAMVFGSPYGAATYQNFVITAQTDFRGMFTNNLSTLNPTSAYWEIRTGVSEGDGGTMIASGSASVRHTATGRSFLGFDEYSDEVLNGFVLQPGTYWFAVVPNDPTGEGRSYNSNTFGLNSFGTQIENEQYFNSSYYGANFANTSNLGNYPTFSSGVFWEALPEPSSVVLLGSGALTIAGVVRRRLRG